MKLLCRVSSWKSPELISAKPFKHSLKSIIFFRVKSVQQKEKQWHCLNRNQPWMCLKPSQWPVFEMDLPEATALNRSDF